ncbi:D-2-hydroxyacid dehydrogenase [Gemmatimonas sp.]|uniref:D-2-hydroxyacid dehydrogenase n=1 Tax=Gemmatimonas sp. TaxID=1962908 RepID=UPI0039834015
MRLPPWAAERLTAVAPDGWEVIHIASASESVGSGTNLVSDEAMAAIRQAEAYFGYGMPVALLQAASLLRWGHSASAGVGASVTPALQRSGVMFTNSAGVYGEPIADTVLAGVLHFVRGLDFAVRQQTVSAWDQRSFIHRTTDGPADVRELSELRVLVVGVGGIGSAVARRFSALGCRCVGIRRRPALGAPDGFSRVVGADGLDAELPEADVMVLAAPLTDGSASLLDARRLALLPAGAIVVNVARGALVSDVDLLDSLNRNHVRGAVLDVFNTEPLPADNPYWPHPKVLVTPHVSGVSPRHWRRGLELFIDNWRRWHAGTPLRNVVDLDAGY